MADWLTPAEAAAYLKLTEQDLAGLRRLGGPKYAQKGNLVRYQQQDLDAWLAEDDDPDKSDGWQEVIPPTSGASSFSPSNEGPNEEVFEEIPLPPKTQFAQVATRGKITIIAEDGREVEIADALEGWQGSVAGVGRAPAHIVQAARENRSTGNGQSPLVMTKDSLYNLLVDLKEGKGEWTEEDRAKNIHAISTVLGEKE